MLLTARVGLLAGLLVVPSLAWADPPQLTGTSPLGVTRGTPMEVTFQGSALVDGPRLIAPFGFQLEESTGSQPEAAGWKVRLAVEARTPVGVYPIRVATDAGISNPILFAVGQLPQTAEVEPNDAPGAAQSIPSPTVVEGTCAGNDRDFYRFEGRKGDRIVVDAACARVGTEVDPMIRLTTLGGRLVASADDTPGLLTDAYFAAVLPEDGAYVLEFADARFAAAGRTAYRLLIGPVPFAGEVHPFVLPRGQNAALELRGGTLSIDGLFAFRTPSDPLQAMVHPAIPARLLGDPAWADSDLDVELPLPVALGAPVAVVEPTGPGRLPALTPPVTIVGRLSETGERDAFTIQAQPGSKHEVRVESWGLGSALDGQLLVLGKDGRPLGQSDDGRAAQGRRGGGGGGGRRARGPTTTDPIFDLTMPEGQDEVKLVVKDLADRGGVGFPYRVVVEPVAGSFQLTADVEQVAIPRGGLALIPVTVARAGFDGPIALDVRGVPEGSGVTVVPGTLPAGQTTGVVGLEAAEGEAPARDLNLQVVGKGADGRSVAAAGTTVFARQTITTPGFGMSGTIPSYARPSLTLAAAVTRPGPFRLASESSKLVIPQGSTVEAPLRVVRSGGGTASHKIAALALAAGLSVAEQTVAAGETEVKVPIAAAADAAPGSFTVGLVARTATRDSYPVAAALLEVEVVRPAGVQLAAVEVAIGPGATAEIPGTIARVAPFAGPVAVKLEGLPAGVTAEPVEVAAGVSAFTVTLRAAADAKPAEAEARAVLTLKLGEAEATVAGGPLRLKVEAGAGG